MSRPDDRVIPVTLEAADPPSSDSEIQVQFEEHQGDGCAPWIAVGFFLAVVAVLTWFFVFFDDSPGGDSTEAEVPTLLRFFDEPDPGDAGIVAGAWIDPSAIAVDSDSIYVLDRGRNRIVVLDHDGETIGIICQTDGCAFELSDPQDMDLHDGLLYVAGGEKVSVIALDGTVVQTIELPMSDEESPQASGIAVTSAGWLYVSDAANDRVLSFDETGAFVGFLLREDIAGDEYVLSGPAGLEVDTLGNVYVADSENGRVAKFSTDGRHLTDFWMIRGNANLSRPMDMAIATDGSVFMTDPKRVMVQVFGPDGSYGGILGLLDAARIDSVGVFTLPRGIVIQDDLAYVIDEKRGVFVFQIDTTYWTPATASVGDGVTDESTVSTVAESSGGTPVIPADHEGTTRCLGCHRSGAGEAPVFPPEPDHSGFSDDVAFCESCHAQVTDSATATEVPSGAPVMPADHEGRAQCVACHGGSGVGGASGFPLEPDHSGFSDDVTVCGACHQ